MPAVLHFLRNKDHFSSVTTSCVLFLEIKGKMIYQIHSIENLSLRSRSLRISIAYSLGGVV